MQPHHCILQELTSSLAQLNRAEHKIIGARIAEDGPIGLAQWKCWPEKCDEKALTFLTPLMRSIWTTMVVVQLQPFSDVQHEIRLTAGKVEPLLQKPSDCSKRHNSPRKEGAVLIYHSHR